MPGWNRECPLGVPLTVYILTLAGPDSFLRAIVSIGRGGSDLRDFGVYSFLLSSRFLHMSFNSTRIRIKSRAAYLKYVHGFMTELSLRILDPRIQDLCPFVSTFI